MTPAERFSRRAGGLDDVVFEDGGAAERAEDADGENGDGDGRGNGESGTQADVDSYGTEEQAEERAEDDGANGEFGQRLFGRNVRAKFSRRRRGTPRTVGSCRRLAHTNLPRGRAGESGAGIMDHFGLARIEHRSTTAARGNLTPVGVTPGRFV